MLKTITLASIIALNMQGVFSRKGDNCQGDLPAGPMYYEHNTIDLVSDSEWDP